MPAEAGLTLHRDSSETLAFLSFALRAQLTETSLLEFALLVFQGAAAAAAAVSALQITQAENWSYEAWPNLCGVPRAQSFVCEPCIRLARPWALAGSPLNPLKPLFITFLVCLPAVPI